MLTATFLVPLLRAAYVITAIAKVLFGCYLTIWLNYFSFVICLGLSLMSLIVGVALLDYTCDCLSV